MKKRCRVYKKKSLMKSGGVMPQSKRNYFWDKLQEGGMSNQEQQEPQEAPDMFVEKKNNFVNWLKNESMQATEDQAIADNIDMMKLGIESGMIMKEGGEQWIQKATKSMKRRGTVGSFSKAAKDREMSTKEFANKVMSNKESYSPAMVKKANFAKNVARYGGDLPKAQVGKQPDIEWNDGYNQFQEKISDKDITKDMGRFYRSPIFGKNKNQSLIEQALQEVRSKYGEDATIENFQIGKTRFNPFKSNTAWTGTVTVPQIPPGQYSRDVLDDPDFTGEPSPITVSGESQAWRALRPEISNRMKNLQAKNEERKERNKDFREKLRAEREYERENAMSLGDAWRTKFTAEQRANIGLGAANMVGNLLGRDEQRRADWQTEENFRNNLMTPIQETRSGLKGDYLGNVAQFNFRPDEAGQGAYGRRGNVAQFGGSIGDEVEMTEEELQNFINLGGEVEFI